MVLIITIFGNYFLLLRKEFDMNRITDYLTGIRRISKLHESMLKEYVCQEYGMTLTEATVISFLYNNPGRDTAADIVELRMMQKGNVSQAVETLVQKNLVKRRQDVEDRRKIHLSLTEESEAIVRTVEEVNRRFQATVFDGITQEEMQIFSAINLRIMQNAQCALERKE